MVGISRVLVGTQFGDEGKARVVDAIAGEYDIIARFNGGPNAGHTVQYQDKTCVTHLIPSGVFLPGKQLYVGSGCVVNPSSKKLGAELEDIASMGGNLEGRLFLSDAMTVIFPHHVVLDTVYGGEIGTTGNGIGFAYSERAIRAFDGIIKNIRLGDVLDNPSKYATEALGSYMHVLDSGKVKLAKIEDSDPVKTVNEYIQNILSLERFICRDALWLDRQVRAGKRVLFEGAQASMLDVTRGSVPFVTSSNTVAGAAYVGGDLPPQYHAGTIGIAKMIMSRVGFGPFISELGGSRSEAYCMEAGGKKHTREFEKETYDLYRQLHSKELFDIGIGLRMLGGEYGATTKRPRRIGMFDLVLLEQSCRMNGIDTLYLTKMDCLADFAKTSLEGIPVVVGYELEGKEINYVPSSEEGARKVKPIIRYFSHFQRSLSNCTKQEHLPDTVHQIIELIEKRTGAQVAGIGVGPERDQMVFR